MGVDGLEENLLLLWTGSCIGGANWSDLASDLLGFDEEWLLVDTVHERSLTVFGTCISLAQNARWRTNLVAAANVGNGG